MFGGENVRVADRTEDLSLDRTRPDRGLVWSSPVRAPRPVDRYVELYLESPNPKAQSPPRRRVEPHSCKDNFSFFIIYYFFFFFYYLLPHLTSLILWQYFSFTSCLRLPLLVFGIGKFLFFIVCSLRSTLDAAFAFILCFNLYFYLIYLFILPSTGAMAPIISPIPLWTTDRDSIDIDDDSFIDVEEANKE